MRNILRYSIVFVILIASYLSFALFSYWLPDKTIKKNIEASIKKGDISQNYPRAIVNKEMCRMDHCTDALIMNQSYCASSMGPLRSVLLLPSVGGETRNVESLKAVTSGMTKPIQIYPRYWHGNTFLARWLIVICGRYANLQLALYYTSSIAILFLIILLIRQKKKELVISLSLSFILLKGYLLQFSIQFFPILFLTIVATGMVVRWQRAPGKIRMILFVMGSLTAFFDLLTTPLLTLGIPLLALIAGLNVADRQQYIKAIKFLGGVSTLWTIGYIATWATKWGLATCLTGINVFSDAFHTGVYRIGGHIPDLPQFTIFDTLQANIGKCPIPLILCIMTLLVVTALFAFNRHGLLKATLFLFLALLPYAWYIVLSNHSIVHNWFTYRAQMITLASTLMAITHVINWGKISFLFHRRQPTHNNP